MAMIKCKECGKDFSDQAASCPGCGCPNAVQSQQTPQAKQPNSSKVEKPKKKKGCLGAFICLGILFIFLIVALPSILADTPSDTAGTPQATEPVYTPLGEAIEIGAWEITVNGFEASRNVPWAYGNFTAEEGSAYVTVDLTVQNKETSARSFESFTGIRGSEVNCNIYYKDEYKYTSTTLLGHEKDIHYSNLNPLETITGILAFSIPEDIAYSGELDFVISLGRNEYRYDVK